MDMKKNVISNRKLSRVISQPPSEELVIKILHMNSNFTSDNRSENVENGWKRRPENVSPNAHKIDNKKSRKAKSLLEMGFKKFEMQHWKEIAQTSKKDLYALLTEMIVNHVQPNVHVRIGGVTFKCHMMVLRCYSNFFMKFNNEKVITLSEEHITPNGFLSAYYWMLAEEPKVELKDIIEVFNAANYLDIQHLISQCWIYFDNDELCSEDNAFFIYLEARFYHLHELELLMLTRVSKFFLSLVASKEFLNFSTEQIIMLLTSNNIGINSEMEVLMSAVRWLNHNWDQRKKDMLNVMKCVRFGLMPPSFLVALSNNMDCALVNCIASNPDVEKMIHEGICFTSSQLYYGNHREEFLDFLERCHMVAPKQRQWIYDKGCNYHHYLHCPKVKYLTYERFLQYLKKIQEIGPNYWRSLAVAKAWENSRECCEPFNQI